MKKVQPESIVLELKHFHGCKYHIEKGFKKPRKRRYICAFTLMSLPIYQVVAQLVYKNLMPRVSTPTPANTISFIRLIRKLLAENIESYLNNHIYLFLYFW
jgi:hypothetical protein